jgi:hypothetical protein
VRELFDDRFRPILARYPLARNAAPEIRDALDGTHDAAAASLEQHLRTQYLESEDPYDKRRFFSIALYLRDLLWGASRTDEIHFDNVDRLVTILMRSFHHVCFVTLNYDLILDRALAQLDPIESLGDYVGYGRWSLVKLHGSVDWGYAPIEDISVDEPVADLREPLGSRINLGKTIMPSPDWWGPPREIQAHTGSIVKLFPALSVPVGEEDEVVCPDAHQSFLDHRLRDEDELDLLILGYSAFDRTVIERIESTRKRIRSLTVVNENQPAAEMVVDRLHALLPDALYSTHITCAEKRFSEWCRESLPGFAASHPAKSG